MSALLRVPVRRDVAMTGEITLRGRVLPIGGLKEKILAAHRAGITTVIMPKENAKDLRDIPKRVLKTLRVVPVEHMDEVLRVALVIPDAENFLKGGVGRGRLAAARRAPRSRSRPARGIVEVPGRQRRPAAERHRGDPHARRARAPDPGAATSTQRAARPGAG